MNFRTTPFVGRDKELAALRRWWRGAASKGGQAVIVTGEAGIGKSALLRACLADAAADGLLVASSQCWEGAGFPPYLPWRQVLSPIGISVMDSVAPLLQTLGVGSETPSPWLDPGARLLLFKAVVDALSERSAQRPLLLAIDDIHAADEASLELLRFVTPRIRRMAVLLVVTYRLSQCTPADTALADIAKCGEVLHLSGLDDDASSTLARQLAVGPVAAEALSRIVATAEGNPFFLRELVRWHEGIHSRSKFPEAITATIRARLRRLGPMTLQVLNAAAVLGRELWVDDVASLIKASESEMDEALREAVEAGVLDPLDGLRIRFTHALFAEVLLADLPARLRSRMHGAAGQVMEARMKGAPSPEGLSELARHFLSAPRDLASSKGVRYGIAAAADAKRRLAFEQAARIYKQVRATAPHGDQQLDAHIGVELGECLWKLGKWNEARAELRRAYAAAIDAGDVTLQARAALGFAGQHESGALSAEGLALLEAAVELERLPNVILAAVLSRLASAVGWLGDVDRARRLAEEALVLARESGDESLLVFVLRGRQYSMCHPTQIRERLATARELVVRTTARFPDQEAFARAWEVSHLIVAGELVSAEDALREFEVIAQRLGQPFHLYCGALWRASLVTARGDLVGGQAIADEALGIGLEGLEPAGLQRHLYSIALLPIYRAFDRTGELTPDLEGVMRRRPEPVWSLVHALALAEGGQPSAARMVLRRFVDETMTTTARDHFWILTMGVVGLLAVALREERAASVAKAELMPFRERLVTDDSGWMVLDTVAGVLGDVDLLLGKPETAVQEFGTGAEVAAHNLMLPALARCLLGTARALSMLGNADTAAKAASEARAIAAELGMPRLQRQAEAVASDAQRSNDPFCDLTASEERVVALVGEGLTNREIAKRLYVSPRTVQTHLHNVFAKLKVSTRAELAARVAVRRNQPSGL